MMKSLVRCLYMVCWRNRLLIPLIITCASFAMLITLFYNRSFNDIVERRDGVMPHRYPSPKVDPLQKRNLENSLNSMLKDQDKQINAKKVHLQSNSLASLAKRQWNETAVRKVKLFNDGKIPVDERLKSDKIEQAVGRDMVEHDVLVHHLNSNENAYSLKANGMADINGKYDKPNVAATLAPDNVKQFNVHLQPRHKPPAGHQSNLQMHLDETNSRENEHQGVLPHEHVAPQAGSPEVRVDSNQDNLQQREDPHVDRSLFDNGGNSRAGKNKKSAIALGPLPGAKYNHQKYDHYFEVKVPTYDAKEDADKLNKRPMYGGGGGGYGQPSRDNNIPSSTSIQDEEDNAGQKNGDSSLKFLPHNLKEGLPANNLLQEKLMPKHRTWGNDLRAEAENLNAGVSLHMKDIQNNVPQDGQVFDMAHEAPQSSRRDFNKFREEKGNVLRQKHAEFVRRAEERYKSTNMDEQGRQQPQTPDNNQTIDFDVRPSSLKSYNFIPKKRKTTFHQGSQLPDLLIHWLDEKEHICEDHLIAYHNEFALCKDIIIDKSFASGRPGGEDISDVINQPEEDEYYQFEPGFFKLPCGERPYYFFNNNNHINQWLFTLQSLKDGAPPVAVDQVRRQFTIAITRYEYANIYHTMTDFYNAFILMELFNKTQTETNILIVDGHPKGALDSVWETLFNSSQRLSELPEVTKHTQLVWGILGYNSLMLEHFSLNLPLIDEFRNFFLDTYRIEDSHKLNCDKLSMVFIWRRDYVAHPRNPSGSISRKIKNEQQLVKTLRQKFPQHNIKGIQIDLFEMRQQLEFIANADILIGMHGAGLTHTLFLPKHAALIELVPVYWSAASEHFQAIAQWRNLYYQRWTNSDPGNESPNYYTNVPPRVLNAMVKQTVNEICTPGGRKITPYILPDNTH